MIILKSSTQQRRLLPKLLAPTFACVLALASAQSFSKGVDLHIEMQPVRTTQSHYSVPDISLRVLSPTVYQIAASSELSQGETILESRGLIDAYKIDPEMYRKTGGVIELRAPHEQYLKEGVYAQQINITIWDSELDIPVVEPLFRYFRATPNGVVSISADEYSRVVEPPRTFVDQSGRKTLEYNGSRLGRKLTFDGKLGFDRLEVAAPVDGSSDDSEKNEP